jgi:hypothetical protein
LFYFRLQSKDAFDNGGKWVHNGDFSVDLHRNPIFARGIIGYKLDAVSIPNTTGNVPDKATATFKWTSLTTAGGQTPEAQVHQLFPNTTFVVELRRVSNTSIRESFIIDTSGRSQPATSLSYIQETNLYLQTISLAGTAFADLGSTLYDLVQFDYDDRSVGDDNLTYIGPSKTTAFFYEVYSKSSEVSFRFPKQSNHLEQDLFFTNQKQNLEFTQSKVSSEAPFVWSTSVSPGQYNELGDATTTNNELLGDGVAGSTTNFGTLGNAIRAVDATGDWKFVQLNKKSVPSSEKWSLVRQAGANGGTVVWSTGQGSDLAKLVGFHVPQISPTASRTSTDTLTAESLSNLSGTQMFYLESNLAGGVVSVNGEGRSNSMIAAVPVTVPFGSIQTRVWDTHNYSIIYPEPKAFSQVTLTLKDQDGRILDPGASEVVLAVQILPWRQC